VSKSTFAQELGHRRLLFQCLTVIESGTVSTFTGFDESATWRVKAAVSSELGVPEISPVAKLSVRPGGSEP